MRAVYQSGPAEGLLWMKSSWSALKSADEKLWAKPDMCLPVVSSLILASVRCSKNIKYSRLAWIEAVHGCRSTSDGDLFICWQKMLHFFSKTGSKVDQLEQGSLLLLKKLKLFCAWEKIFPVHEQRKDGPLGQAVGSLQLIMILSAVQIWVWCVFLPLTSELYLPPASEAMVLTSLTFRRSQKDPHHHYRYFSDCNS